MPIKALIFDLDDTLWPVAPVIMQAEAILHAWMAVHVPQVVATYSVEDLREKRQALVATNPRFSYDLWALRHSLLRQVFIELEADPLHADAAMQIFAEARNRVSLYADVMPALPQLGERFVLGSISNGFADLQAIGLAQHFSVSLAAHSFGCAKPDPRIFLAAAEHLNLRSNELMYVGDDLRLDVQAAQAVGMQAAWMNRHGVTLDLNATPKIQPDLIVRDLHDLLDKLSV